MKSLGEQAEDYYKTGARRIVIATAVLLTIVATLVIGIAYGAYEAKRYNAKKAKAEAERKLWTAEDVLKGGK